MIMKITIDPRDYQICKTLDRTNNSYIYGEINPESFGIILGKYEMDNKNFIDIGSGCGRLLLYLQEKYEETDFYGVEIDSERHLTSITVEDSKKKNSINQVTFENSDFNNVYFGDYDILYCGNTIFEVEENDALYRKLLNEFSGVCFLFTYNHLLKNNLHRQHFVDTSWQSNVALYSFIF